MAIENKIQDLGRNVQEKIDETRIPAAGKLQSAASALHRKADSLPGGGKVTGLAHGAADKIQATADYLRRHDTSDMAADLGACVRRHPGQSLLVALAAGFF